MFIDPDNPLAAELIGEAAAAYFLACKRMVTALEALSAFDREMPVPAQDDDHLTRRSQLLDDAAERVHAVLIQREAMRLSWSKTFFEDYAVPAEVIARLGRCQRE